MPAEATARGEIRHGLQSPAESPELKKNLAAHDIST
jgi:hypothetical protein